MGTHSFFQTKLFVLLVLIFGFYSNAKAYSFEVDGFSFSSNDETTVSVQGISQYHLYINSGNVIIPSVVAFENQNYVVTGIGSDAFSRSSELKSVTIPNTITSIGEHAFYMCANLHDISIPNSVKTIGAYAFLECSNLNSISFSDSISYIGRQAFTNTAWFNNQPDGLVYVGLVAYY